MAIGMRKAGVHLRRLGEATVASCQLAARAQQPALPLIAVSANRIEPKLTRAMSPRSAEGLSESRLRRRPDRDDRRLSSFLAGEVIRRSAASAGFRSLIRRRVAVITTIGTPQVALTAKAATTTIPIVIGEGEDPVGLGLVANLARPNGNVTGIYFLLDELATKRLRLLHDMVPKAARVAVLVNPANRQTTETTLREVREAAPTIGLQIQLHNASTIGEIDAAFATFERDRPDALFVAPDAFFTSRRGQFATLTARDRFRRLMQYVNLSKPAG